MADTVPTVRVMPSHPSQGEFVEINASDFDEKIHKRWPEAKAKAAAPPAAPAPAPAAKPGL